MKDQGVETVSLYTNGPFTDLCRGPHGPGTKRIKAFKLTSVAGAYWRGDAERQMLTRVYGTAWASKEQLEEHLKRLEEARARDHRKLGRELDLFMLSDLSPGSPFWLPKGHPHLERAHHALAHLERGARLQGGAHADPLRRGAVEAVGPLARLPRPHVLHGRGGQADGPQAHELPRARADLQARPSLLPRPADPLRRAGPRAPARAERHAPRPPARAPHHPGRRPRVLPRGPDRGGGGALPRLRLLHLRPVRLQAAARALDAAGEAGRHRGDVGQVGGRAEEGARGPGPRVRPERGRRRLLRPEDRPPHDRHDRPLVAARHRPARLLHARAVRAHLHGRGQPASTAR